MFSILSYICRVSHNAATIVARSRHRGSRCHTSLFRLLNACCAPKGVRCHAWLYLPTAKDNGGDGEGDGTALKLPPVVLMGHGMGAQKVTGDV